MMTGIKKDARTAGTDPDALQNIAYPLYIRLGGLSSGGKKDRYGIYVLPHVRQGM